MTILFLLSATYLAIFIYRKNAHFLAYITLSRTEHEKLNQYYSRKFSFYKNLPHRKQKKFIHRAYVILKKNKIIVDEEILHVYIDVELMISAAFVQVTFGYSNYEIERFSKIIVYPDSFYSKLAGNHVNGLTVGNGYIYLSWNHFLEGYMYSDDKINLALHELAHALYIDKFHLQTNLDWYDWEEKAMLVFRQLRNNPDITFFRDYARTNMAEFWAVAVEVFFEDPVNFNKEYPTLYKATAKLLKQDLLKQ